MKTYILTRRMKTHFTTIGVNTHCSNCGEDLLNKTVISIKSRGHGRKANLRCISCAKALNII